MFMIIGGDGKEYGPATVEQIRAWLAAGRANLDTKAKGVGSDEWRRLADYPEFSGPQEPPIVTTGGEVEPVAGLAPRETRLLARLIDWAVRFALTIPGTVLIGPDALRAVLTALNTGNFDFSEFNTARVILGGWVLLMSMLVLFVVQLWLLSTRGQSIGKVITKIRIVRVPAGGKVGFVRAWLLREFVPSLLGFVPIIGPLLLNPLFTLVDCCFIFRDDRRCIHDFIAGTVVVMAR
jgi:uncharacterized RDD family membrane protein YckC